MENTYKRVSIPKWFLEDFDKMRFVVLKLFSLLEDSNLSKIFDYENRFEEKFRTFTSRSTWELQREILMQTAKSSNRDQNVIGEINSTNEKLEVKRRCRKSSSTSFDNNKNQLGVEYNRRFLSIWYVDANTNDYLEITNNKNCERAVENAYSNQKPLYLMIVLNKCLKKMIPYRPKSFSMLRKSYKSQLRAIKLKENITRDSKLEISVPNQFQHLSSIIDCEHLPSSILRVKIYKQGEESRPLGFYLREGVPDDINSSGIYISRIIPSGLAALTGVMQVNDQILEVNGIDVLSKSINQVCEMITANSHYLILTLKSQNHFLIENELKNRKSCSETLFVNRQHLHYPFLLQHEDTSDSDTVIDV